MATSALDLLIALDARLDDLETATIIPGSVERVRQEWRALARTSLRLLQARRRHPNDGAQRLGLLLVSIADEPDARPLPAPGTGLMAITTTIGCIAEVMRIPTVTTPTARTRAGEALGTNLEAALARAARWTQRGFEALDCRPDPQIIRLGGLQPAPTTPAALRAWRIIGPTDPGIDGAIARWEAAATDAITKPRLVTQHALQLAAADIALLCAAANAITDHANQSRQIYAGEAGGARTTAGSAWRQAARWPSHLRLGGRSTQLRHASADLRERLDDALRTGSDWKPPAEMFADTPPEQLVTVAHSGLQSAIRVGHQVVAALDGLTRGASRVWLDASHTPMPKHSVQEALDGLRYDWRPDPAAFHSAETLHHNASNALARLVGATPHVIEAVDCPSLPLLGGRDDSPWETVSAPLDPLRTAQERAKLAAIVPSEQPARAISR